MSMLCKCGHVMSDKIVPIKLFIGRIQKKIGFRESNLSKGNTQNGSILLLNFWPLEIAKNVIDCII